MRYTNISNVVARISNKNDADSLKNAVLVNGHFDSVFTSEGNFRPNFLSQEGAADDCSSISSMLEMINNLLASGLSVYAAFLTVHRAYYSFHCIFI